MSSIIRPTATLAGLVQALGGDLYAGGYRALVPAPGHSGQDRSVSLLLENGRVVAHGFGGADWKMALDDLRQRGWIDAENRLLDNGAPIPTGRSPDLRPLRSERIAVAARLWSEAGPITDGSPARLYARRRAVDLALADAAMLRAHAAAPASVYRDRGPRRPALLAAICDRAGALTAVELTYLDRSGRRSAIARPPRKMVGVLPAGCAVRLAAAASTMVVAEGVFTTLSAMRRFGLPGWALLSTGNLRRWTPPPGAQRIVIAADRGPDGERSATILRRALSAAGLAARVAHPPAGYGDWNDLDQEEGEEGRVGAPGA